jgi:hypothetical protein
MLAVALVTALAGGCSDTSGAPSSVTVDWRPNARQVVQQLQVDIAAASIGGTTQSAAEAALADTSDLYGLLVAYSDLGGCRAMVSAASAPPRVVSALEPACARLQHAAALFARAAQGPDPLALARATRETMRAQPQLVRAMLAIRRG